MTMVGVWELGSFEDDPHKKGGMVDPWVRKLLPQVGVHAVADNSEVGKRDSFLAIRGLVGDTRNSLPFLPLSSLV
jgi:hypothetical protein